MVSKKSNNEYLNAMTYANWYRNDLIYLVNV